jgi:sulfide:quinone oxidoreductase
LATEQVTGFYENAQHILTVEAALKFRGAIEGFKRGRAVIGQCAGARLDVPVYETAFALSHYLEANGLSDKSRITIVSAEPPGLTLGDGQFAIALRTALEAHNIEVLSDFPINRITPGAALTSNHHAINFNLLMLLPPFRGSSPASRIGITDSEDYINVNATMRVVGVERMYAVGDCVNFTGPKMGHMAVHQAEIAAANLEAELRGQLGEATYNHQMLSIIDEGGGESIYLRKDLWAPDEPATVKQGRFWSWAKRAHEKYWQAVHS